MFGDIHICPYGRLRMVFMCIQQCSLVLNITITVYLRPGSHCGCLSIWAGEAFRPLLIILFWEKLWCRLSLSGAIVAVVTPFLPSGSSGTSTARHYIVCATLATAVTYLRTGRGHRLDMALTSKLHIIIREIFPTKEYYVVVSSRNTRYAVNTTGGRVAPDRLVDAADDELVV